MDTTRHMEPCAGYEERLILSRYGELGPEEEKALGAHLSGCPACRAYMDGLESALVELPDTMPGPFAARKAVRGVMERISDSQSGAKARPAYMRYLAPAFAALALIVAAAWVGLHQPPAVTTAPVAAPVTVASGGPDTTPATAHDAAPANVIANTTAHQDDTHAAAVEVADSIEMLADLDLMEDLETLDRLESL
ncbi:MAG: zf-HC2 domain-containing protein [Nitrospirae bacterium]|nr:zf-HC2 domain-containing protein [Nitrospirota bacterium]